MISCDWPFFRWAGVGEARGDYPFSHHKLTVQFPEASAAQDRKLEGLVHKAIQELWRPDPSELTLLLTKGVDSTFLKVPPSAFTLTGSSDPCYVEAYHLSDSSDGRVTLHLKVISVFYAKRGLKTGLRTRFGPLRVGSGQHDSAELH